MNQNDQAIEQQIHAKGKTAPRVTPADIEANIASEWYFTASDGVLGSRPGIEGSRLHADTMGLPLHLLTFCVLVLRNGFTVTGESACASPENFDAEIGRQIARENAVQKVWPLMGYALKQELHRRAVFDAQPKVGAQVETKTYVDGTKATGPAPLPDLSPAGALALQPHQQRVVDEKAENDERLTKLIAFTKTPIFAGLDSDERNRLDQQAATMAMLSDILGDRIAAFAPAHHPV
jgi:hypothetical protein